MVEIPRPAPGVAHILASTVHDPRFLFEVEQNNRERMGRVKSNVKRSVRSLRPQQRLELLHELFEICTSLTPADARKRKTAVFIAEQVAHIGLIQTDTLETYNASVAAMSRQVNVRDQAAALLQIGFTLAEKFGTPYATKRISTPWAKKMQEFPMQDQMFIESRLLTIRAIPQSHR